MPKTVLILEDDLGFAFWLGHTLDQAGFNSLPANSVPGARSLLAELGVVVDLIIVNTGIADAAVFVAELRSAQPGFKVIAVVDDPENLPAVCPYADLAEHKPMSTDETVQKDWVDTVRMVLSSEALNSQ